jgi:hypothetical protein
MIGEIIQGANERATPAIAPIGIAFAPIGFVIGETMLGWRMREAGNYPTAWGMNTIERAGRIWGNEFCRSSVHCQRKFSKTL